MLRRALTLVGLLLVAPALLAAGLGLWSPAGAWQQHLALDFLLQLLLWLEHFEPRTKLIQDGLVGVFEVPLLVGGTGLLLYLAPRWEKLLPQPVLRILDVPEAMLAALGLVAGGAVLAVGAALDRPLFFAGLAVAVLSGLAVRGEHEPREEVGWRAPSNRRARVLVGTVSAAVAFYCITSLWEGATFRNPVFEVGSLWLAGAGRWPWVSGTCWLLVGLGLGGAAWQRFRQGGSAGSPRPRHLAVAGAVALLGLAGSLAGTPGSHLRTAGGLSGLGLLLLAGGVGPWLMSWRPPKRHPATVLDPRHVALVLLPVLAWAGLCILRGFTVFMWTAPPTLPAGVERLADPACVFSLSVEPQSGGIFYTDRCRTELGMIRSDGQLVTWDLREHGAEHVEELGGPDDQGMLWAAVQANVSEARLVMLAIAGERGPRKLPDPSAGDSPPTQPGDEAFVPMRNCWVASWVPVLRDAPGARQGDVLLGCENRAGAAVFRTAGRKIVDEIELTTRMETGTFSPEGDRLYGVSLWADPRLRAWAWPGAQEVAQRVIGPFNWTATSVPDPETLWVSRFVEGTVLVLNPETLQTVDTVRLSFGVRAMTYDPVHDRVWAAASYTGRLWSIEPRPPYRRTAIPLCGETRDLAVDPQGRVIASTNCGIFRLDPEVMGL